MFNVKFSIMSYYPSVLNNENINVGLLFHAEQENYRFFYTIDNYKRLESFDDELDIVFFKDYLKGVKESWEGCDLFCQSCAKNIESFVYNYGNELRFSNVMSANVDDIESFVNETIKMNFRFDFPNKERPSGESIKKYLKKFLKCNSIEFSSNSVKGKFEEDINYDFVVDNIGYKSFLIDNDTKIERQINNFKGWAYSAETIKAKSGLNTVFIIDTERNDEKYKLIHDVLSSAGKVLKPSDVLLSFKDKDKFCIL